MFLFEKLFSFLPTKIPQLILYDTKIMKSSLFRINQYKKLWDFIIYNNNFNIASGCYECIYCPLTLSELNSDNSKAVGKSVSTVNSKMPIWSID